jgi:hypothetical protein
MTQTIRTAEAKIALIQKWGEILYDNTETFSADAGDLGGEIAYLYNSMTRENTCITLNQASDLMQLLYRIELSDADRTEIMSFIELTCSFCDAEIVPGERHFIDWPDGRRECQGSVENNEELNADSLCP